MRTHEDALRSFKRYLALALGDPMPVLAAAKWFPDPADFDPEAAYPSSIAGSLESVTHVWFDLNVDGDLDAAELSSGTGFVPLGFWNGVRFWANPPGVRYDAGTDAFVPAPSPDESCVSPALVAGCTDVPVHVWAAILAAPRWGLEPPRLTAGGRPYRCAMLTELPASIVSPSLLTETVAASEVTDPEEWDIRFMHDLGEFQYPALLVKPVGAAQLAGSRFYTEVTQAFTLYAYPHRPDEAQVSGSDELVSAERVRQLLSSALVRGGRNGAKPMRLPLYDYEGIPIDQPAGRRLDTDFLKVIDASVDVMPEPTDNRLAVVIADVRLNWRVAGDDGRGTSVALALNLALDAA